MSLTEGKPLFCTTNLKFFMYPRFPIETGFKLRAWFNVNCILILAHLTFKNFLPVGIWSMKHRQYNSPESWKICYKKLQSKDGKQLIEKSTISPSQFYFSHSCILLRLCPVSRIWVLMLIWKYVWLQNISNFGSTFWSGSKLN